MSDNEVIDGRRLRSERSRSRLIEAAISYIEEYGDFPTAAALAEHSGIAHRSIFRLFENLDEVRLAVLEHRAETVLPLYETPDHDLPLADRIEGLVKIRGTVNEKVSPVRRVAKRYLDSAPKLAEIFKNGNSVLQKQAGELFSTELATLATAERRIALNTIDLALSWESWDRLRNEQGLSSKAAQQVIAGILTSTIPVVKGKRRK